jgi:hypothetical protein
LSEQGDHQLAVKCFGVLYDLIERMENGEEIIFADEYGSWMIPVEEKKCLEALISSLAIISTSEEFAKATLALIRRDSCQSFSNKVYSTVMNVANTNQKACVEEEVKRQDIRTKPGY